MELSTLRRFLMIAREGTISGAAAALHISQPSLSRQASSEMRGWFKRDFEELDIVATYNLLYNAALLARRGIGYVVSPQGIVDVSESSGLTFRPLEPALTADVRIAWKRYQTFSPAAEVFLHRIRALWG
ncbi:LysR family transcriptional regulator [Enorma phocaeensis]|uniref:LysR family transcriptional regulator n=1 Tax=Enorma phocaeensis TaxID=1871019 RepID=A0A921LS27_9ACTN|nr:LysR family transcriptional regulator [Enorma phocaeensis]HJG36783.1 LysR family transcriptional regulator [Enorma phocaeensis]